MAIDTQSAATSADALTEAQDAEQKKADQPASDAGGWFDVAEIAVTVIDVVGSAATSVGRATASAAATVTQTAGTLTSGAFETAGSIASGVADVAGSIGEGLGGLDL